MLSQEIGNKIYGLACATSHGTFVGRDTITDVEERSPIVFEVDIRGTLLPGFVSKSAAGEIKHFH